MKVSSLILALALTIASTASAQTMQAIRPVQLATPATQAAQIDTAAMEKQRMERGTPDCARKTPCSSSASTR